MKNDYLWDRSGEPDPEIEKLEQLLSPLRYDRPAPDFSGLPGTERNPSFRSRMHAFLRRRWVYAAPAVAALVLMISAGWWFMPRFAEYEVESLDGEPRVEAVGIEEKGRLGIGQWLETDAVSRARIRVGEIGQVEVEPNTRIGLLKAREGEHRLSLARGIMHAMIWAPSGSFFVNTPSAEAIDLGCMYTLEVYDDGSGLLRVTAGWVAFERQDRESFVPAGAACQTRPGSGPGTPYQESADPEFLAALQQLDFGASAARAPALEVLLARAQRDDALTLWHLLFKGRSVERAQVYSRLAVLIPPPSGVNLEGALALDRNMLDLWWNALGLGGTQWWRMWKQPLPSRP